MKRTQSFSVGSDGLSQISGLQQHPFIISQCQWVRNPGAALGSMPGGIRVSPGLHPFLARRSVSSSSCRGQNSALCNCRTEAPALSLAGGHRQALEATSVLCHVIPSISLHASSLFRPQSPTFIPDLKGSGG